MTDAELLDKVCNFTDRNAKPLVAGIGGYILSVVVIAWKLNDWIVANAQENPYALVAFGIGGVATGAFLASLFWRRVVRNAFKANAEASEDKARAINERESIVTLADHEAAIERETAPLRAAIEEKDAEISRLKELVESYDRVERERALRDMMDDYYQSGAEDVAVSPQPTADAQYDEVMRWMGRQ